MPAGGMAPGPGGESGWFCLGFRWAGGAEGGPEPLSAEGLGPVRRVRPSWSFAAVVAAGGPGRVRLQGAVAAALPRDCLDALPSETHVLLLREAALEAWPAATAPDALLEGRPVWRRELRAEEAAAIGGRRPGGKKGGGGRLQLTRPFSRRAAPGARRLRGPPAALLHSAARRPPGAPIAVGPGARAAAGGRRGALLVGRRQARAARPRRPGEPAGAAGGGGAAGLVRGGGGGGRLALGGRQRCGRPVLVGLERGRTARAALQKGQRGCSSSCRRGGRFGPAESPPWRA